MPGIAHRRAARSEVVWTLTGFVLLAMAFVVVLDVWFPFWTDREYAARRQVVLDRNRDFPERPILAVLGSSRVGEGFVPERMGSLYDFKGRRITVINYSHLGAGPRMNLIQLHRLLRDGVIPSYLLVELVPAHLHHESMILSELSLADIEVCRPFWKDANLLAKAAEYRLTAQSRYRVNCLQSLSPALATGERFSLSPLGSDLEWEHRSQLTDAQRTALTRTVQMQYADAMAHWKVDPSLDGATREMLRLCREHAIHVGIVLFPESSKFRSWYGEGVETRLEEYLAELSEQEKVSIFDERGVMPDDGFIDPHHLGLRGAAGFSGRFERDVIRTFLADRLLEGEGFCSQSSGSEASRTP